MNELFTEILNKHETDDSAQASAESSFVSVIKKEFSNSEEILKAAEELSLSVKDVFSGNIRSFPVVPIRQSSEFYVKKHTASQIPYFHSQEFYELVYVHKGSCRQTLGNGSNIVLTEKQCCLLSPRSMHLIEKSGKKDIILKAVIPCALFGKTGEKVLGKISPGTYKVFDVSETAQYCVLKLLKEELRKNAFYNLIVQSYLILLFTELAAPSCNDTVTEHQLYAYFKENIKTASLSGFAEKLNYNENYLSRLIKKRTGASFSAALCQYRMDFAKELLSGSSLSVEDIAAEAGYANASGFYKRFYERFGISPSEYRKLYK